MKISYNIIITTLLAIFLIISYVIFKNWKKIKYTFVLCECIQKLPCPPSSGYLGNLTLLHGTPDNIFKQLRTLAKKYYPIYGLWTIGYSGANMFSPEDFELILSNSKCNNKSFIYVLLESWLGTGLLLSNGDKWSARRKMLTPTFHFNILNQFVDIFNEQSRNLVQDFYKECHKPYVEIDPIVSKFTLKSVVETVLGTRMDFTSNSHAAYKDAIAEIRKYFTYRLMRPWLLFTAKVSKYVHFRERQLLAILHNFTRAIIQQRQIDFLRVQVPLTADDKTYGTKKRKLAMLDLLLSIKQDEGTIDDEGIREEVDTFTFEGHDTSSAALTFTIMLLACNRDEQDKIYEEMENIMGNIKNNPTPSQLYEFKYMERCIKESLRLYPSVPYIAREVGEDLVTHKGYKLLKGSIASLHIYDLHHSEQTWPDPEKFDPDRFLPENCRRRHPFAYLPFSSGARNCIGQKFALLELKSAIYAILANFILEPIDTPSTIVLETDIILRTTKNIRVKFIPRKS